MTYTRVGLPLRLVPLVGDTAGRLRLLNLAEPTRVLAADLSASWRHAPFTLGAFYAFRHGTEGIPGASGRRDVDLVPTHRIGLAVGWRSPRGAGTAVDADLSFVGPQTLTDNAFRTSTSGYGLFNGLVSQRSGRARLYVSGENLFDVKLRNYEPVFFDPIEAGRRTNAPWVPLRGRVISLGALVDW
jgi:iron complex outermembrane receptor protein